MSARDTEEMLPKGAEAVVSDETSPLGIFLVKSGCNGDRLLFRYPYEMSDGTGLKGVETRGRAINRSTNSPYALTPHVSLSEDHLTTSATRGNNAPFLFTELFPTIIGPGQGQAPNGHAAEAPDVDPYLSTVIGLSDLILSNLFAVKPQLCGQKFEVKINDVRFVGHPVLLASPTGSLPGPLLGKGSEAKEKGLKENDLKRDVLTFNVVLAVKANASHDIVNCYHECSQRVAIALHFEENRVGYLSQETKAMISVHDEIGAESEHLRYRTILEKSQLASDLKQMFEDLNKKGMVHLNINKWVNVSFCLPQKVHKLTMYGHRHQIPPIGPETIKVCLESLRPYHGVLLLVESEELLESLPQDASPAVLRIIKVIQPTKNLLELSADSDISLAQVFHVVSQLVYWGKVTIIYPLCANNVYTIHPLAPTNMDSPLVEQFRNVREFEGQNLLELLSEFSLGVTLSQMRKPTGSDAELQRLVNQLTWMLKHRLVLQLHIYIYLMPLSTATPYLTERIAPREFERPTSSLTMTEPDQIDYSAGSSFPSEGDYLGVSPGTAAAHFGTRVSSKSGSDDELSASNVVPILEETAVRQLADIGLNPEECENILKIPASKNLDELKLFARLCPYFNGRHHVEDIMYYENVRRSQLLAIIDKFRDVLLCSQCEDAAVSQLCPYHFDY